MCEHGFHVKNNQNVDKKQFPKLPKQLVENGINGIYLTKINAEKISTSEPSTKLISVTNNSFVACEQLWNRY